MTQPIVDQICGCPVVTVQSNRRDRRSAVRRGQRPTTFVVRHRAGCVRQGKTLSDPRRTEPTPPDAA